jgi:hypothetical protein
MSTNSQLLQRIINNAQIHLPGAIEDVFKVELYNVCEEFFKTTNTWQEMVPFVTIQDKRVYEIVPTVGLFVRLMNVTDQDGFQRIGWMTDDMFLTLRDTPTGGSEYTAFLAVTCVDPVKKDGWPEAPEDLLKKFYEPLLEGLLGRMMLQPSKPYSSPDLGVMHMRRFHDRMAVARTEQLHQSTYNAQSWRFPKFA